MPRLFPRRSWLLKLKPSGAITSLAWFRSENLLPFSIGTKVHRDTIEKLCMFQGADVCIRPEQHGSSHPHPGLF